MQRILVVVDMQEDFIRGPLGNDDCRNAVNGCVDLCDHGFRGEDFDWMVFTRDTHQENYLFTLEGRKLPVKHCIKDTAGWEIIPELKEWTDDASEMFMKDALRPNYHVLINKNTFGDANQLPAFISHAWNWKGDDVELHFCGVCTSICVLSNMTICRAHFPNTRIFLHRNATGDVTPQMKEAAFVCANSIQCEVVD